MDSLQTPPRGIIFDLGDVLFKWTSETKTTIPSKKLRSILSTPIWHSYDRGEISRENCYQLSAQQFDLPVSEIAEAFAQARASLQPDDTIVSFLREAKKDPSIRVYAMSNIGQEDFEELATGVDWTLFDRVFTSAAAGMRKPELGFYQHVLDNVALAGNHLVFVDDKKENVEAAKALGIRGFVFEDSVVDELRKMFFSPIAKGWRYLLENAKHCNSTTESGITFGDNFAKLLILDALRDESLCDLSWGSQTTWNFFSGENERTYNTTRDKRTDMRGSLAGETALIPGGKFPDDLDTTSLALSVLRPPSDIASSVLDTMVNYVTEDGGFQTYYDRNKARVDPIASANILACFYSYNRGRDLERTLQLVRSVLVDRSYVQGTHYYASPDVCLGFIGRLLRSSGDAHLQTTLGSLMESRLRERLGLGGSALDLAMRITTCAQMGIACEQDRGVLLNLQCKDGSWEAGWMYQYGSTGMKIGNRAVTTAMAVAALSA